MARLVAQPVGQQRPEPRRGCGVTELDAHLDTLGPDLSDDATRDAWRIDGERTAGWAMRKLAQALRAEQRIVDQANDRIALIEQWRDQAIEQPRRDAEFFLGRLREWRDRLDAEGDQPRTIRLPEGTIGRRKTPDSVEWVDADLFTAWCERNEEPDLVSVVRKPRADRVKDLIRAERFAVIADPDRDNELVVVDTATGEEVPGVRLRVGGERIDVRPDLELEA